MVLSDSVSKAVISIDTKCGVTMLTETATFLNLFTPENDVGIPFLVKTCGLMILRESK